MITYQGGTATTAVAGGTMTDQFATPPTFLHDVSIKKADNGFIVTIGCKTLVAKDWKELTKGLELYWKDPKAAEKKYCN